jgi:hypothetical protein
MSEPAKGYVIAPAPEDVEPLEPATLLPNAILAELCRDGIWQASVTSPRSLQPTLGASEIGGECNRQMAYRARGVPAVNQRDPMRMLAGTGMHEAMAELYRRLDGGSGRYLVEQHLVYRGIPGTVDLFDRRRGQVIDWKSVLSSKLKDVIRNGPPRKYVTQVQTYGAGLAEAGERVESVAVVYVCLDGELSDLRAFTYPFDRSAADDAIDRYNTVAAQAAQGISSVGANPTRLCPWCNHFRPGSKDVAVACPGDT